MERDGNYPGMRHRRSIPIQHRLTFTVPRMGALRGSRARATHSLVQVSASTFLAQHSNHEERCRIALVGQANFSKAPNQRTTVNEIS